ncbi:MAG: undecaprenyldiphospho-muramoylpentapeptide beta-N-acetylglucosaminyltransferase [Actinomycetota bacterium]
MKVAIAGGGTAGHVNPAIALAQQLGKETDLLFVGTTRGIEARLVPAAGFDLATIEVQGFDRSRPHLLPLVGARALRAVFDVRATLKRFGPDVVVGMGGYVSLPTCLAARSLGVPVVLHEQNIVLGLAHRVSKPFADRLAVSFGQTLEQAGPKGVFTGNPVMQRFLTVNRQSLKGAALTEMGLSVDRSIVLVFGGSLGARRVNEATVELARLWAAREDVQILHITGRDSLTSVLSTAADIPSAVYKPVAFIEDMVSAYAVADVAVCRGGATTVAELCVMGLPAVIVPYPHHRDRQQERHAEVLKEAGAALVLDDQETTGGRLAEVVGALLADPGRLVRMSEASLSVARPDAARRLADVVREVVG